MNSFLMEFVGFKKKSDLHLARKFWHIGGVSLIAVLYAFLPTGWSLFLLSVACCLLIATDVLRLSRPEFNQKMISIFGPFMRESEVNRLAGTTYLISGVTFIAFFFPREVVQISLWFLAFADPLASYFGIKYGREKILGDESLQGSLAALVVCAVITWISLFIFQVNLPLGRLILVSLLGGVVGALAELLPISKLDDNLTLPILSAAALWCVFAVFGVIF